MKAVIINLASEIGRWVAAEKRFAAAGLSPHRVDAVVGAAILADDRQGLYSKELNARQFYRPLVAGEIGCYASHIHVWQELVASKEAAVAVFEDDVELSENTRDVLEAITRLTDEWDMIKLIGRPRERPTSRQALISVHELIRYARVPSLTGAYALSRRGAEKLIAARVPFGRPVDVDLRYWWECRMNILGVQPYPVRDADSSRTSGISGRRSPESLVARLRKACFQVRYTVLNRLAIRTEPALGRLASDAVFQRAQPK